MTSALVIFRPLWKVTSSRSCTLMLRPSGAIFQDLASTPCGWPVFGSMSVRVSNTAYSVRMLPRAGDMNDPGCASVVLAMTRVPPDCGGPAALVPEVWVAAEQAAVRNRPPTARQASTRRLATDFITDMGTSLIRAEQMPRSSGDQLVPTM